MESENKNIMPHITITPMDVLRAVGDVACSVLRFLPENAPMYMSNHYRDPHPFDAELYDIPQETRDQLDYGTLE